jgi:AraC-like DNA-binding protein
MILSSGMFKEEIGLSPKEFSKIIRFRKIVENIYRNPEINLYDLAYNFNYTDPSHLVKDFKFFTGLTPTAFIQKDETLNKKILTTTY